MAEMIILARIAIHELDLPALDDYYKRLEEALPKVDGFHGLTLWQSARDLERYLAIYRYADSDSAKAGLKALVKKRALTTAIVIPKEPPDVLALHMTAEMGHPLQKTPVGGYLSLSIRVAEPGYGEELAAELERIFEEIKFLDGYLGSMTATNDALSEEVVGIVGWASKHAFEASLPRKSLYEIDLFQRVR